MSQQPLLLISWQPKSKLYTSSSFLNVAKKRSRGLYSPLDILLHESNMLMDNDNVVQVMYPQNVVYFQIAKLKFETSNRQ